MIISNADLDFYLIKLCNDISIIYPNYYYQFKDLYMSGCRFTELGIRSNIFLQKYNPGGILMPKNKWYYEIQCLKGGLIRKIMYLRFSNFFNNYFLHNSTAFNLIEIETFDWLINRYFHFRNVTIGNKGIASHLFRYNFIRIAHDNHKTDKKIADEIGESNVNNIPPYYNNNINYTKIY
jgi:hypothetical protein